MMHLGARRFIAGRFTACRAAARELTVGTSVSTVIPAAAILPPAMKSSQDASVLRLRCLGPTGVDVYLKRASPSTVARTTESLSTELVACAERQGEIEPGQTLVHALSADSGIGLAEACSQRGYSFVAVVSVGSPARWCESLRLLGARVLETNKPEEVAVRLAARHNWFHPARIQAESNAFVHERSVGPEIVSALGGRAIDFFVSPPGVDGMLRGVGAVLRRLSPQTQVLVVEPDSRPHPDYEAHFGPHPSWPGKLIGEWDDAFGQASLSQELRAEYVDGNVLVSGHEAAAASLALAEHEGVVTGVAGGALVAGALRAACNAPEGSSVLIWMPEDSRDDGSPFCADAETVKMSEEEAAILRSVTPPRAVCAGDLCW